MNRNKFLFNPPLALFVTVLISSAIIALSIPIAVAQENAGNSTEVFYVA